MQKSIISFMTLIILLFVGTSCDSKKESVNKPNKEDAAAIRTCIEKHLKAMQDEDVDAFWETYNPTVSRNEKNMINQTLRLTFDSADMSYTLDSFNLISVEDDSATAEVVVTTKKISGSWPTRDCKTTELRFLKKVDGKWYLTGTQTKDMKAID